MGLGPIMAIYQARYARYLEARGLADTAARTSGRSSATANATNRRRSAALASPPANGSTISIFVINCNLQRLDGPVRGNGKIIQELEGTFRGAGWNVIKCIWGSDWDELLARDTTGALARRMMEVVDGEYQEYAVRGEEGKPELVREKFFNTPELKALVADKTDEQLAALRRGGHDPIKVFNAYRAAINHRGAPSVMLVKTVKGYGTSAEASNTAHQEKKLEIALTAQERAMAEAEALELKLAQELKGAADVPRSFRPAAHRRRTQEVPVLPAGRRFAGDEVSARTATSAGRLSTGPQHRVRAVPAAGGRELRARLARHAGRQGAIDDAGVGHADARR